MISYTTFSIIAATTINVYTEYGFITEELEPNTLVITHGSRTFNFDVHMRFPSFDISQQEKCLSRELYNTADKEMTFDEMIDGVNNDFERIIKQEVETIIDGDVTPRVLEKVETSQDLQRLMANLDLCGKELNCLMDPVNTDRQPGTKGYSRYKNQIYPCFPSQALQTDQCSHVRPNAICCYVQNSKNGGNCPMDALEEPIIRAQHYLDLNPSVIVRLGGESVPIKTVKQFCFVLNKAALPNGTILYENYTNEYLDPIGTNPFLDEKREAENRRKRRSTSQLWDKMKHQQNLDLSLEHVDILNSSISELKMALEHPERKVASMFGDVEQKRLTADWLCDYLGAFKSNNIIKSLYDVRSKLERELERLDFECRTSMIPTLIPNEILLRFCRVVSINTILSVKALDLVFTKNKLYLDFNSKLRSQ